MKIRAKFLPLLLLSFLWIAVPSRAAGLIGQTYDVCVAQLGTPTKHVETGRQVVSDLWTFTQGNWSIEIGIWQGVVQLVTYKRADGKPLSPDEVKALLAGFADSYTWAKDPSGSYRRSDQLVKAKVSPDSVTFLTTLLARSL